jgi:hypothetical protein
MVAAKKADMQIKKLQLNENAYWNFGVRPAAGYSLKR